MNFELLIPKFIFKLKICTMWSHGVPIISLKVKLSEYILWMVFIYQTETIFPRTMCPLLFEKCHTIQRKDWNLHQLQTNKNNKKWTFTLAFSSFAFASFSSPGSEKRTFVALCFWSLRWWWSTIVCTCIWWWDKQRWKQNQM